MPNSHTKKTRPVRFSTLNKSILTVCLCLLTLLSCKAQKPLYPSYKGLVMCGYQGWFRAPDDPGQTGEWWHFGRQGRFDPNHITIDLWPDMSEYETTYPTDFIHVDSSSAHIFSSLDKSTADLHFKWMQEYGIDGVFMQRFYYYVRDQKVHGRLNKMVISNALEAADKYDRAIAIMYDLSGLAKDADNLDDVIEDWKSLVDELELFSPTYKDNYLHHNGKPLVAIWGLGFNGRPYDITTIQIDKFIDFLKHDPTYGGMSIMIGVPTYFRTLDRDCTSNPFLHDLIKQVDIVQPWHVGRFSMKTVENPQIYTQQIKADVEWCREIGVDYVPTVYPGFSWYNLQKDNPSKSAKLNSIPRYKGRFLQTQIDNSLEAGAEMLYVAMFDEIDEGTAIFKCTNTPPINGTFIDYEGLPSDFYLRLVGDVAKKLKELK